MMDGSDFKSNLNNFLSSGQMDFNKWKLLADKLTEFGDDLCVIRDTNFIRVFCDQLKSEINQPQILNPIIQILILLFQHEMLVKQLLYQCWSLETIICEWILSAECDKTRCDLCNLILILRKMQRQNSFFPSNLYSTIQLIIKHLENTDDRSVDTYLFFLMTIIKENNDFIDFIKRSENYGNFISFLCKFNINPNPIKLGCSWTILNKLSPEIIIGNFSKKSIETFKTLIKKILAFLTNVENGQISNSKSKKLMSSITLLNTMFQHNWILINVVNNEETIGNVMYTLKQLLSSERKNVRQSHENNENLCKSQLKDCTLSNEIVKLYTLLCSVKKINVLIANNLFDDMTGENIL